jgi:hypothetical protein
MVFWCTPGLLPQPPPTMPVPRSSIPSTHHPRPRSPSPTNNSPQPQTPTPIPPNVRTTSPSQYRRTAEKQLKGSPPKQQRTSTDDDSTQPQLPQLPPFPQSQQQPTTQTQPIGPATAPIVTPSGGSASSSQQQPSAGSGHVLSADVRFSSIVECMWNYDSAYHEMSEELKDCRQVLPTCNLWLDIDVHGTTNIELTQTLTT